MKVTNPTARKMLAHPALFFGAGLVAALIMPGPAKALKSYILTPMIIVMFLSTTEIRFKALMDVKRYGAKVAGAILLNYGFVSTVALFLAWTVFKEGDLYAGFVMMAAMPTAIAVIPLSYLMKGNVEVAVMGVTLSYILALGLAPALVHVLLGSQLEVWRIFETLMLVILFPLLASRLLIHLEIDEKMGLGKDVMVNICFFMVMFIIIGVNYDSFFLDTGVLVVVAAICLVRSLGTGVTCLGVCRALKVKRKDAITYTFFSSFKNLGIVAAIALVLFGERASIPAALGAPIEMTNYIILAVLIGWLFPDRPKDDRTVK
jgi:BASS family bile acid:Na+ symporter